MPKAKISATIDMDILLWCSDLMKEKHFRSLSAIINTALKKFKATYFWMPTSLYERAQRIVEVSEEYESMEDFIRDACTRLLNELEKKGGKSKNG